MLKYHRFSHRMAPDKGAPAGGGGESTPATTRGVTVAERESRSAQERDLSPENESSVPDLGDITQHLNLGGFMPKTQTSQNAPETESGIIEISPENELEEQQEEETPETEVESEEQEQEEEQQEETEEQEQEEEETTDEDAVNDTVEADDKTYKLPPEVQKSINGRFAELTAKRKEAERQVETLTAERDELRGIADGKISPPIRLAPTEENPLADVSTIEELQARFARAQAVRTFCIGNAKGADVVVNAETGEKTFWDEDKIREVHVKAERELSAMPERAQFLQTQAGAQALIAKHFPEAAKKGSAVAIQIANVKRGLPWMATVPQADVLIADSLVGEALRSGDKNHPLLKPLLEKLAQPAVKPPAKIVHQGPKAHVALRVPTRQVDKQQAGTSHRTHLGDARSTLSVAEKLVGL